MSDREVYLRRRRKRAEHFRRFFNGRTLSPWARDLVDEGYLPAIDEELDDEVIEEIENLMGEYYGNM